MTPPNHGARSYPSNEELFTASSIRLVLPDISSLPAESSDETAWLDRFEKIIARDIAFLGEQGCPLMPFYTSSSFPCPCCVKSQADSLIR